MIHFLSAPTNARSFLSDRNRARADAPMAESFTRKRAQNNWRGHYDRAVSLATWYAVGRQHRLRHLGSPQQTADTDARTLFFVHEGEIVLLHGFVKKTRKTPKEDRALALERKNAYLKSSKN